MIKLAMKLIMVMLIKTMMVMLIKMIMVKMLIKMMMVVTTRELADRLLPATKQLGTKVTLTKLNLENPL